MGDIGRVLTTEEMHDMIAKQAGQLPLQTIRLAVRRVRLHGGTLTTAEMSGVFWHLTRLGHLLEDGE